MSIAVVQPTRLLSTRLVYLDVNCVNHQMYRVVQVCKQFRGVFTENPQWHTSLYLPKRMGHRSWESLLVWISGHNAKVQEVYTFTRQGTVAMTSSRLHTFLYPPEFLCSSMNCRLSAFTALSRCCLDVSAFLWVALDLGVLQGLQHLSCLALEGHGSCKNLHLVQHLTTLVVCQASVAASRNCSFVDRLQCLDVQHGEISGMHSAGLAACQQLRHLRCKYGVIGADADTDTLTTDESATFVPSSISQLIVLESLQVDVAQSASLDAEAVLDLDWLTGLSSLKRIVLWSEYAYIVPSGMSKLSKLEDFVAVL